MTAQTEQERVKRIFLPAFARITDALRFPTSKEPNTNRFTGTSEDSGQPDDTDKERLKPEDFLATRFNNG